MKELQSTLAFYAYVELCHIDGLGMEAQQDFLSKLYHGDADDERRRKQFLLLARHPLDHADYTNSKHYDLVLKLSLTS